MRAYRLFVAACSLWMIGNVLGCPRPLTIHNADYGNVPDTYQQSVQTYMENYLDDPSSAQYRFVGDPVKGYAYLRGAMEPPEFGYLVSVGINVKNRMGGYAGEQMYTFLLKNHQVWKLEDYMKREIVKEVLPSRPTEYGVEH